MIMQFQASRKLGERAPEKFTARACPVLSEARKRSAVEEFTGRLKKADIIRRRGGGNPPPERLVIDKLYIWSIIELCEIGGSKHERMG